MTVVFASSYVILTSLLFAVNLFNKTWEYTLPSQSSARTIPPTKEILIEWQVVLWDPVDL